MKNTILKYGNEVVQTKDGDILVSDYFSNGEIYSRFEKSIESMEISDYITTIMIDNDSTLEKLSYELYGTSDYWDLILLLNLRDPLFDMPYNYDAIYAKSSLKYENIKKWYINKSGNNLTTLIPDYLDKITKETDQLNERVRIVRVPIKNTLSRLTIILRREGFL